MRVLIVGASGLVGSHCRREALARGHEVLGTFRATPVPGLVPLDLRDIAAVRLLVRSFRPAAVLCCSAWSWVDGCEADLARAFVENRDLPAALGREAHLAGARFLHFSSSYVFNGRAGPYSETDAVDPISIYGRSKLEGEAAVSSVTEENAVIVRTMGVFGLEQLRKNFVYQVIEKLSAGRTIRVPNDQFGNATYAEDLAQGSLALIETGASGIWNLAGPKPDLARNVFAQEIARHCGLDGSLIESVSTSSLQQPAPRPSHGGLSIDKAIHSLNWHARDLDEIPWKEFIDGSSA